MSEITTVFDELITLSESSHADVIKYFLNLHPGIQADVFELFEKEFRNKLLSSLTPIQISEIFNLLDDPETVVAANLLSIEKLKAVVVMMEPDEAADLIKDLPPNISSTILSDLPTDADVHKLIQYPDDTAGGRMTTQFFDIKHNFTISQVLNSIQSMPSDFEIPYFIFITDTDMVLKGVLGLREIVSYPPNTLVANIYDSEIITIDAWEDQEKVAQLIQQYEINTLPVINQKNQLLGVITHDDIMDVVQEEATEDLYRLANVSKFDIDPDSPVTQQLKGRLPWLFLNTLTALFASWVIGNFEDVLAQVATLAIFQSVVAGQGGNAASQSVALFVRAIAVGNLPSDRYLRYLWKQFRVGLIQGLIIGTIVGSGVYFWKGNLYLGIVIGISLILNIILAGIVGTITPLGLQKIGLDPALASTVLVTAATDSIGFFIFLSIAKYYLPEIMRL